MKKIRLHYCIVLFLLLVHAGSQAAITEKVSVPSQKMNKHIPAIVVLPDAVRNSDHKFPVVYLLHGHSGHYQDWSQNADLGAAAEKYQVIIVCPDGSTNSWYLDSEADPTSQYETFVGKELMDWIDARYPTVATKQGRAITGLSMGGHGSLYLAFRHPENYIAAGSMSGGVDLTYSTVKWELAQKLGDYEKHPDRWHRNSVVNLVGQVKGQQLAILIDCGVDDFFIDINRNLHQKLVQQKIPHDYVERPGGHSWDYWVRVLEYHLLFFSESFRANHTAR
ncbi:MAG: alpha/beta hydrolase [Candidatus Zhuqueibacterota bacterium]